MKEKHGATLRSTTRHVDEPETSNGTTEGGVKHEREMGFVANTTGATRATHAHAAGTDVSTSRLPGKTINVAFMLLAVMLQKHRICNSNIESDGAARKTRTAKEPRDVMPAIDTFAREDAAESSLQLEKRSHFEEK